MTEKLHVLHVVGAMNIGGIENMLMTLMPNMMKKGIIFDFVVHGDIVGVHEASIKKLGGRVYHLPKFIGINIFSYLRAWRRLLFSHPELKIIHGHMTSTASIYLWLANRYDRVTIAHSHSTSISGGKIIYIIKRILEYPLRYISDYLCACSIDAADYRFGKGISKKNNFFLWHNAINTETFKFSSIMREQCRRKLRIDESTIVIGHVGRMIPAKNHVFLLEIFFAYHKINNNSKLLLIGDGPLRTNIEKIAERMGCSANIIFTGTISNPHEYLSAIDVFCFPSIYEGLPVSLIEAQVNERICVASDVISDDVMISNALHFMSLQQSPAIWAEEIRNALEQNEEIAIRNLYDVSVVSEEVQNFYLTI